jgi:hypothetical protein
MSKIWIVLLAPLMMLGACASQPANQAKAEDVDRHCLEETGSRIEREGCAGHGRSVSRDELERSGGMTTGESLKRVVN